MSDPVVFMHRTEGPPVQFDSRANPEQDTGAEGPGSSPLDTCSRYRLSMELVLVLEH